MLTLSNLTSAITNGSSSLNSFQALLKNWEESRTNTSYDPTDTLTKLSEILEKEHDQYTASDPDPFEDRHPYRVDPECQLGQLLKAFFKKESLVQDVFNNYLRDNYWVRIGQNRSSFDLNVAAARLVLDIVPGLQTAVMSDTDGLVHRLYKWVEFANEPLRSYATGLLGVASELSEVATDAENRDKNTRIVPLMLSRLKSLQREMLEHSFIIPHSVSEKKGSPEQRRLSNDGKIWTSSSSPNINSFDSCSNSSWAEMESQVICQFHIHPLTSTGQQVFILRLLSPLAEYQEFLSFTIDSGILDIISNYLNVNITKDTRLAFEALRFQAGLFCHKKLVLEWVSTGGVQKLLSIPRPSIASTAVSQVLYYIGCDDDCMEKLCCLPPSDLNDLMKYVLWLIECSHDSGRQFAIMFSYNAFSFRILLELFDQKDGIRTIYNTINTLPILNLEDNRIILSDDQEYLQRQSVRQVLVAFKRYAEAHLIIRVEQLRRSDDSTSSQSLVILPGYKPARLDAEQMSEHIEVLLELMPFRSRWPPIDKFIGLGGVTTCLQVIAIAYDWTFQGRAETVRSALECLAILATLPKVQLQFCDRIELPDDSRTVGINILLGAAEGEIVQDSPDVQRAALNVIINCVCAPIGRPGGSLSRLLSNSTKKKSSGKTSEDLINKVWDCVRTNNGIMALLQLLHTKTPLTDADSIRALACRALTGLARSSAAQQIMSKLSIFTNGTLQQLVREPILQDKRGEHVKFQHFAHDLLERVSGPSGPRRLTGANDYSLEMLHRASVVAQTKIKFSKKQLYTLIQDYLFSNGLVESAMSLMKEANLPPLPNIKNTHSRVSSLSNSSSSSSRVSRLPSSPVRNPSTPSTPLNFRLSCRRQKMESLVSSSPSSAPRLSSGISETHESSNTLVSIISDYLSSQHSLCQNPMSTCPEFDLFLPHKCPDPRSRNSAPTNFTTRIGLRSHFPPYGGPEGRKFDLKLMYSRFRPIKTFRPNPENENSPVSIFTSTVIMPDDQFLLAGTYTGEVRLFNLHSGSEEAVYNCHESQIHHIQASRDGKFILTSSSWRTPYSTMWSMGEFFESKMVFNEDDYVEFSNVIQDKVIGTANEVATIYDVSKNVSIRTLKPQISNNYMKNRATFDPTDELVLNDGVLYDLRMNNEIRKLDKLNQNLSGVFHPNGLEIVSNSEVWDIRTFHLLKTVPQLDQCQITFSNSRDIIYGVMLEQETEDGERYESSFRTLDASDYSNIATIETRRSVLGLSSSSYDLQLAVVENSTLLANEESVVRLYDVGRLRAEEEEYDDNEDEEEKDEGENGNDSDDSNDDEAFDEIFGPSTDDDDEDDEMEEEEAAVEEDDAPVPGPENEVSNDDDSWEDMDE